MRRVSIAHEKWIIPTYPVPQAEELPMFAETRNHQGTTGNPYPNRVVQHIPHNHKIEKEYDVICLENEYIRVAMIPELGGRVFEAYDKVNDYHFLYRQHVIKPALIGCFGAWISGGLEFNWPFHHRPSTFMPVDYAMEECEDGSAICWLSECDPTERTKGMVGIVLKPGVSYFETRVKVTNRTELEHQFLWWQNGAVRVHNDYQVVFPPDVTWAHHHNDKYHTTFPEAYGRFGGNNFIKPTNVGWLKNSTSPNSYFAAPSRFSFFGGYDYARNCGTIHVADPHKVPGKKMFTWGWNRFADKWEGLLTDEDGKYCELMAGAYSDDQPDFTWLAPYETKRFSQYWYPTRSIGYVDFANLDGAVALDKEHGLLRLNVTREVTGGKLVLREGDQLLLEENIDLKPCQCASFSVAYTQGKHTVTLYDADGVEVLSYSEFEPDAIHIPKDNPGIPTPDKLFSAQDNYLAGAHLDQYRDPWLKPDIYYEEALKYDSRHLPSLIALGEYRYRTAQFDEAQRLLQQAMEIQNRYNSNPKDGTAGYLLGLCYLQKDEPDCAYSTFLRSAWSYNSVSRSNTRAAMIDGLRKDYEKMLEHAQEALDKESTNPLAGPFAAYAMYKLGNVNAAKEAVEKILKNDCMNQLARYFYILFHNLPLQEFYSPEKMNSNPAQTCIDVAFDLANAGIINEAIQILEGLWEQGKASTMSLYCLAYFRQQLGREDADLARRSAQKIRIPDVYPYRLDELRVLRAAITADPADGTAWNLLGCILYDKKHYHDAAECWEKAIENAPDFYVPYRNLAVAYFSHLGRAIDALELTKKALSLKPNDDHLLCEISSLMAAIGENPEKRAEFIAQRIREESTDDVYKELIYAYNAAGNYEKAMETILCHVYTPGEGGEAFGIDSYMFNCIARGRKAMSKGAYEEALALFEDSLRIPENLNEAFPNASVAVPAYYYQVLALNKLGREQEAKQLTEKMATMDIGAMLIRGGDNYFYAAQILCLNGRKAEADTMIRNAILAWEKELGEKAYQGRHLRTGRFYYQSFIDDEMVMQQADLYYLLGYAMLYLGDKKRAAEYFTNSLRANPENVRAQLELELLTA